METIWWTVEGALSYDVICCLLVCSAVVCWTLGKPPSPHISAWLQCVAYWVWPRLAVEGQILDGEVIYPHSLLMDGCHSTDHILAIQWAFVPLGMLAGIPAELRRWAASLALWPAMPWTQITSSITPWEETQPRLKSQDPFATNGKRPPVNYPRELLYCLCHDLIS